MENGPAAFSMRWFDDITVENGVLHTNKVKTIKTGAHCMVLYGWNEVGWKVQNSWGTRWGNRGTVVIPYDTPLYEVWGIRDAAANSHLIMKKPFKTKIGEKVAKLLNGVLCFVYNIFHNNKER